MDTGLTIRPTDGTAQIGFARPGPAPAPQAVATDLAPSQAVAASAKIVPTRNDAPGLAEPATRIDIAIDKRTHEVVFRIVDAQTGHVITEVPQQAQVQGRGSDTPTQSRTDFTV